MDWYGADSNDKFGTTFFSQSLYRSNYFLVAICLFVAVFVSGIWFYAVYGSRLSGPIISALFVVVFIRALQCMLAAVRRHGSIRNLQSRAANPNGSS